MQSHGFILHLLSRCLLNGGVMTAEPIIRAPISYLCFMWDRFQPILDFSSEHVLVRADIALHGWIVDLDAMDSDTWSLSRSQNPLMPHYAETQEFDTLGDSCIPSSSVFLIKFTPLPIHSTPFHNHSTRITKKRFPPKTVTRTVVRLIIKRTVFPRSFLHYFLSFLIATNNHGSCCIQVCHRDPCLCVPA